MARFTPAVIVSWGSKPKLLCSERTSPRTATSEDVTRTAQIAICATRSTSRIVSLRPILAFDPALTISYGLARRIWRIGTMPNKNPLSRAKPKATSESIGSGLTGRWSGTAGMGCQMLIRRNSMKLTNSPAVPPAREISSASVSSPRRMRLRLEPSARRRATSRERSAARAANRLPRLAHAASRISPESTINPATNARTAGPNAVRPSRDSSVP